jgi:prepilin-type N-terminal cleavage/methylation domain-containing protein
MDFKNTSTSRSRCRAMTLIELMVATAIGTIVMTAVAALSIYTARSFSALMNYVDLDAQSRKTLDQMTWKMRHVSAVRSFDTNNVSFTYMGTGTLSYAYAPRTKELTETWNGRSSVLLKECDTLKFSAFQRTTASGTFDQTATTDTNLIKEIQVSWSCSRKILGSLVNSESVQSAKIVLRNN